jgi:hypothetical protein
MNKEKADAAGSSETPATTDQTTSITIQAIFTDEKTEISHSVLFHFISSTAKVM